MSNHHDHTSCSHEHHHDHHCSHECPHADDQHDRKALIGLTTGVVFLLLSLSGLVFSFPMMLIITAFSVVMTVYLGESLYRQAWKTLGKEWNPSLLYTLSTLSVILLSILSLWLPGAGMMLESAPLILGFWHLGESIEHWGIHKVEEQTSLLKGIDDPKWAIGETKTLAPGAVLPVDAELLTDNAIINARENEKDEVIDVSKGYALKQGMKNEGSYPIQIKVSKMYAESDLAVLQQSLNKPRLQAPIIQSTSRILKYFVPGLLVIAIGSGIAVSFLFSPFLGIQTFASVLVSACPCALSLITPLAFKIAQTWAITNQFKIKDDAVLQKIAEAEHIVFDLNGTLTDPNALMFEVSTEEIKTELGALVALEKQCDHLVARRFVSFFEDQSVETYPVESCETSSRIGIKGRVNGTSYEITQNPEGHLAVFKDNVYLGVIQKKLKVRPEALECVKQAKKLGIKVHINTGESDTLALDIAKELEIDKKNVHANQSKKDKETFLKALPASIMVGDFVNDLLAMQAASVSIAIGKEIDGKGLDVYIQRQKDVLLAIPQLIWLAQETKKNIEFSLMVSLLYNVTVTLMAAGLMIAMGFSFPPAVGVALMILESSIVLLNVLYFKEKVLGSSDEEAEVKQLIFT